MSELIQVFVSYSTKDSDIAEALSELLLRGLALTTNDLRISGIPGFQIPPGESIAGKIQDEVRSAKVFVALITKNSLASSYCMFEIGARWGSRQPLLPVYAAGAKAADVNRWLGDVQGVDCSNPAQIGDLVFKAASLLNKTPVSPGAYLRQINNLAKASEQGAEIYAIAAPILERAEYEKTRALMEGEEGTDELGKAQAIFWETLRKYFEEDFRSKNSITASTTLQRFANMAGPPPHTVSHDDLAAWASKYADFLTESQGKMWEFVVSIYPRRQPNDSGQVWEHSAIKPVASAEEFHWARRMLAKFWNKWPPLVPMEFITKRFETKRETITLLAWLELALVQWTQMHGEGKQALFTLAAEFGHKRPKS